MSNVKLTRGVTLVELLVVIGLIGILASVILVYINPVAQFQKARDVRRKTDLGQIQGALEFYRTDSGFYPIASVLSTCGGSFTNGTTTYLRQVPCDPVGVNVPHQYKPTTAAGNSTTCDIVCDNLTAGTQCVKYCLFACLENVEDAARDAADGVAGDTCPTSGRVSYTVRNP